MNIDKRLDEIVEHQHRQAQNNAHAFNQLQQELVAVRQRLHKLETSKQPE